MLNSCIQDLRRSLNKEDRLKRKNRLSLMLNNREARALGIYCSGKNRNPPYSVKTKANYIIFDFGFLISDFRL
jgi:hypothetical protein